MGRYNSIADIADTVIDTRDGVPIFLGNVADVKEATAIRRGIATRITRKPFSR